MILQDTVNPYLAARAVFLLVQHGTFAQGILAGEQIADAVRTIAFPWPTHFHSTTRHAG